MKKYFIKSTGLLFITLLLLNSCRKDEIKTIIDEATIIYDGNPAVDGCGYFLSIKEVKYKPIELTSVFSVDGLIVNVEYQLLDAQWSCNWQENKYNQIKIINISKKTNQ